MMLEMKIGIRLDKENGIHFFGLDDVNAAIADGARVVEFEKGDAFFVKAGHQSGQVRLLFTGGNIKVRLATLASSSEKA